METPTPKALVEAINISPSYASMILGGQRTPPRSLAIHIFRKTGWKHDLIASLSAEQIDLLEQVEPWTPPKEREAA